MKRFLFLLSGYVCRMLMSCRLQSSSSLGLFCLALCGNHGDKAALVGMRWSPVGTWTKEVRIQIDHGGELRRRNARLLRQRIKGLISLVRLLRSLLVLQKHLKGRAFQILPRDALQQI